MAIHFYSENIKKPGLKFRLITKWLKTIISQHNKTAGAISYIFCDDQYLLEINKKYLQHNYFTDIITFDYVENDMISGDIFISCDMVNENSKKFGVILKDEYLRVISHGMLHLLGFKDSSDVEKVLMRKKETECINLYNDLENGIVGL